MPPPPIHLAVLISGSGTTLQNLIDKIADGSLNARINLVIASRPNIAGIDRANRAGLRCEIVERAKYTDITQFSRRVFDLISSADVDLVCLAGWLSLLEIPAAFAGKMMNIHPALLPDFGGKGMYGLKVHQAVLQRGDILSGCTVHFVDATYDTGPIILQRVCPVLPDDTPESLAHRVFEEEKQAYPDAIRLFHQGRVNLSNGRSVITPEKNRMTKSQ